MPTKKKTKGGIPSQDAGLGVSLGRTWMEKHIPVPKKVPPLFHYTGAYGIKGIVESNRMWATGAQHMNDWSEVVYGHGIMVEALRKDIEGSKLSARCKSVFSNVLETLQASDSPLIDAYFASFCERANLLSQWRAYGGTQGYAVEFDPLVKNGQLSLTTNARARNLWLAKVIYDADTQRKSFATLVRDLCDTFDSLTPQNIARSGEHLEHGGIPVLSEFARVVLSAWVCTVKHPGFAEEQEWRVIFQPQITDNETYASTQEFVVRLEGRNLVTHVELRPADILRPKSGGVARLPLKSILCGPSVSMRSALRALEILLRKNGFEGVRIGHSEIPAMY